MRTELITADAPFRALHREWEALWRRADAVGTTTPFQSPAWLLPWWEGFGTAQPRVAALWGEDAALLGLLPLYLLEEGTERKLLPMGVGITDYLDALLDPAAPAGAASALLAAVLDAAVRDGVTSCDLPDLPPQAALRTVPPPPGWREEGWDAGPCPVLVLPDGADALRGAVPSGTLRKLRMARHRADRAGGWSAEVAGADDVLPFWDALVGMHQARWTRRGEEGGVLGDPAVRAFHRAALPRLFAAGALRLHALRIGGAIAAVYHVLAAGGDRLLFYLSGFDEARGFESPGTLLLGHVAEAAIAEGRRELHFLRGGEAYKYAWGGADRRNAGRRLIPP